MVLSLTAAVSRHTSPPVDWLSHRRLYLRAAGYVGRHRVHLFKAFQDNGLFPEIKARLLVEQEPDIVIAAHEHKVINPNTSKVRDSRCRGRATGVHTTVLSVSISLNAPSAGLK